MGDCKIQYKNSKFINQKIDPDRKFFGHCRFEGYLIILERGELGKDYQALLPGKPVADS